MSLTRRQFVRSSAALSLTAAGFARAADRPGDKVRVAVMGVHGRGKQLLPVFLGQPDVEVTHLIDPDESVVPAALAVVGKKQSAAPKVEKDVRRVLEDKSVTALVVSAPDHWHALATVWACQAGKHVYVEKPVSHNLVEGRRMVQAARKYNRVVQVGTQRRSAEHVLAAREFVKSGKLGKVPFARTWIAGNRPSIGKKKDAPVPKGVDYSLWLGPAADRPFNPNRFHYNWHWFWDYGTGELGNNGIHGLDVARLVLGLDAPTRVTSSGGKYFYNDDQQTPDTQLAAFDFPGCTLVWEHRIWAKTGLEGSPFGVAMHGENGTLVFDAKGWHVKYGVEASHKEAGGLMAAHVRDFLDRIRDGKTPNADIEEGHKSTRLCHLGNIAYRLGKTLHFDAATETTGDQEADKLLAREYRAPFTLPTV
ncbi:MAG TPA: Gfo/Idh/MocA family oxidoreductase [Fimbriiglobus sp.]|nr:Gfo/Idh/MocA family oxidoreductase [Fimbriiglobus sp.]